MPGKSSNRDRIARMQAEASAVDAEKKAKAEKSAAKRELEPRKRATGKPGPARIKIVWAVCDQSGVQVTSYPYAEEAEAIAEAKRRTESSGRTHFVNRAEVTLSS
jgi:hypothetical protein